MRKFILLSVCFILAFSTMFAQERTNRGRRNEQQKQEVVSPPVTQQEARDPHENQIVLPPQVEKVLNSLEMRVVPEGEIKIIYSRENFSEQGALEKPIPSWNVFGVIKDLPEDKLYGASFNLTINLPFNSSRNFIYDGKSLQIIDSEVSENNLSGLASNPEVLKKFQEEFYPLSYHMTGDFILRPITLDFLRHSRNEFKMNEQGNLEITFHLPPRGDAVEELKLITDASLNLQKIERVYRFRDQSKIHDSWIISKK